MSADLRPTVKHYLDAGYDVCPLLPGTKKIVLSG